jgi:hypothetical protein
MSTLHVTQRAKKRFTCLSPVIKNITATSKERDEWDESAEGEKKQRILMHAVATYAKET